MSDLLDSFGTDAERTSAEQHQVEENEKRMAASIEVARKHKAQFANPAGSNEVNIESLNTEVNVAINALQKYALPGESILETADRGRASGISDPIFKQVAVRAVTASKTLIAEQEGAAVVIEKAKAKKSQSRTDNMLQTRRADIRNEARKVAQREGISLGEAFTVVMMEIDVDGAESVLPSFSKLRANYIAEMVTEAEEEEAALSGGAE